MIVGILRVIGCDRAVENSSKEAISLVMKDFPLVWIILGVAGSGKTSVGRLFAAKLECDFLEGDRRHPAANVDKMRSQTPLEDRDRREWLLAIEQDIRRAVELNRETVLTCSALKVTYRQQLTAPGRVQLVWIEVPTEELKRRLTLRPDHFMKPEMLDSQLATFEALQSDENAIILDGMLTLDGMVEVLMRKAHQQFPSLAKLWWERCLE
jgi:gluconokinase